MLGGLGRLRRIVVVRVAPFLVVHEVADGVFWSQWCLDKFICVRRLLLLIARLVPFRFLVGLVLFLQELLVVLLLDADLCL